MFSPCDCFKSTLSTHIPFLPFLVFQRQACPNSKKLSEDQTAAIIKSTAVTPKERKEKIEQSLKSLKLGNNQFAKEFGISVQSSMEKVTARSVKFSA